MKILFGLYQYFPYGGLQKDTLRTAREAVVQGHQPIIFTTRWEGPMPKPQIQVELSPNPWYLFSNTRRIEDFGRRLLKRATELPGCVTMAMNRLPGADCYFAADSCMKLALPQTKWFGIKKYLPRYRAILRQEAELFAPNANTRYLLICEKQKREFQLAYPQVPISRYAMLPPGIDEACLNHRISPERRRELRIFCGLDERQESSQKLLITVGTNLHRKGVDRALQLMADLPDNIHYLLIGNDSPKAFQHLLKQINLTEEQKRRCHFIGPRKDVADFLCAADLMIHPAREEGTGTVLLEAVSCGLPVVCSSECGWAPYIAEIYPQAVTSLPFTQDALLQATLGALQQLSILQEKTRLYADTHDFTRRAAEMVRLMTTRT